MLQSLEPVGIDPKQLRELMGCGRSVNDNERKPHLQPPQDAKSEEEQK